MPVMRRKTKAGCDGLREALADVAQILGTENGADLYAFLVTRLARRLDAEHVLLFDITERQDELRVLAASGPGAIAPGTRLSQADLKNLFAVRGYLGIPLAEAAGRPLGMLAIAWREAPADIRIAESLARLVAARASAEIERRHLESTVRKLAALPAADPHPVLEFSGDGVLRFHNDAAIRLARSLGKDDPIYILPRDSTYLVKTCLATGRNGLIFDSIGGDRTIVWSFVPIVRSASVFARAFELSLFLNLHEEMKDRGGRARSPGPSGELKTPGRPVKSPIESGRVH